MAITVFQKELPQRGEGAGYNCDFRMKSPFSPERYEMAHAYYGVRITNRKSYKSDRSPFTNQEHEANHMLLHMMMMMVSDFQFNVAILMSVMMSDSSHCQSKTPYTN